MKKLISFLLAGLVFTGLSFAQVPAFDKGNAYVVEANKLPGSMKDHVIITNLSSAANFDVKVYVYQENQKKWILFGQGKVKGLGDKQTIKTIDRKNIRLENYNYIAITSETDHQFKYSSAKGNNDLNVWYYDDKNIDESHFKVFDLTILPSFRDNLKIVAGQNFKNAASFKIYAYNDEAEQKKDGTIAVLTGPKSKDSYSTTAKGFKYNSFKYIKIVSREEKDFKYTVNVERNDLIITVNE